MTDRDALLGGIAARHGFSPGAVAALDEALRRGGGRMAQFSHPELGGMGQWSSGMLQIGAMFDDALKARVAAALAEVAAAQAARPGPPRGGDTSPSARGGADGAWWPAELGPASASGAGGGVLYAVFAQARRLAIVREGRVTVYDTASHRIGGVSQAGDGSLVFTGEGGAVDLARLRVVGSAALDGRG